MISSTAKKQQCKFNDENAEATGMSEQIHQVSPTYAGSQVSELAAALIERGFIHRGSV